jgi:hypothetical protein
VQVKFISLAWLSVSSLSQSPCPATLAPRISKGTNGGREQVAVRTRETVGGDPSSEATARPD